MVRPFIMFAALVFISAAQAQTITANPAAPGVLTNGDKPSDAQWMSIMRAQALAATSPALASKCGMDASACTVTPVGAALAQPLADIIAVLQRSANRSRMSVSDYCLPSQTNGAIDNTACVQAAVTAFCALQPGGGVLPMPGAPVGIRASAGIQIPCQGVTIQGVGWGNRDDSTAGTKIVILGSGSAPIFNFTGASKDADNRYAIGGGVKDLMFYASNGASPAQLGAMIAFNNCLHCTVDNVYSWNAYRFLTTFAGLSTNLKNSTITQVAPGGEAVRASGSDTGCAGNTGNCPGRLDIFKMEHTVIDGAFVTGSTTAACIHISDFVGTSQLLNVTCNQTSVSLKADCPTSASLASCPQFITLTDFETEPNGINNTAAASGMILTDVVHMECTACQLFGYNVDTLVTIGSVRFPGSSDYQFIGGRLQSARGDCLLSSAAGVQINGTKVLSCNGANVGGVGLHLRGNPGGAGYSGSITVMGAQFCYDPAFASAPTTMGAILFDAGTDYNVAIGNNFRGCQAGLVDNSGGTHNGFSANVGP